MSTINDETVIEYMLMYPHSISWEYFDTLDDDDKSLLIESMREVIAGNAPPLSDDDLPGNPPETLT